MQHRPFNAALIRLTLLALAFSLFTHLPTAHGQEPLLQKAVEATKVGNLTEALAFYRQLEQSSDPWYAWAGTSGEVVVHRMAGDGDSARVVTERIAAEEPKLAGLMTLWDGDTANLEGDFGRAVAAYRLAADRHGRQVVDGDAIGVIALRQLSRAYLDRGDALTAAQTERELLRGYSQFVDREAIEGRALALEAMASGLLPVKPLEKLLHDGDCSAKRPCVIGRGRVSRDLTADARPLGQLEGLYFVPERGMAKTLETRASSATFAASSRAKVCAVRWAKTGFSDPMVGEKGGGYAFMESPDCCNGFHPGIDLNRGGPQKDCNDPFFATADGCVRDAMSSELDWGSATVSHRYRPGRWTSQYGHAYDVYVSAGQAIGKGALMGKVGGTGEEGPDTFACHLHFEIREADHTDPTNASAYHNASGVFTVKWFLDGVQVGYGGHESLDPDEVSNGNIRFDWTPTAGTHTLQFVADADDDISETNEDNNRATDIVDVLPSPSPEGLSGEAIRIFTDEPVETEAYFLQDGVFRVVYAGETDVGGTLLYRLRHNKNLTPTDELFHVVLKMISGPAGTNVGTEADEVAGRGIPSYYSSGSSGGYFAVGDILDLGDPVTDDGFPANMKDGYFELEVDFSEFFDSVTGGYSFSIEKIYSVDKVTSQETTLWLPPR